MKNVAFIILGIENLCGGGGAERQFADTYDAYQKYDAKKYNLLFIIDKKSLHNLNTIDKLIIKKNLIVFPELNIFPKKIRFFIWNFYTLKSVLKANINLLHVCLPRMMYLPFLFIISKISLFNKRVNLVFNATDCTISHNYNKSNLDKKSKKIIFVYLAYMKYIDFKGVFSWYKSFKEVFENNIDFLKEPPLITTAKYCFTNLKLYKPMKKKKIVIWAGRLEKQKNPFMFVDALKIINEKYQNILRLGWKFYIYGEGSLKNVLESTISKYKIDSFLSVKSCNLMSEIFGKSSIFVSTQDYENFTSLSMLEAMACGNIIISRNVGQTENFVRNKINGLLLSHDTADNLAYCINDCITNQSSYDYMHWESVRIATEEYKADKFLKDIEKFWMKIFQ